MLSSVHMLSLQLMGAINLESTTVAPVMSSPIEPSAGVRNVVFTLMQGGDDEDVDVFMERTACLRAALKGAAGEKYDMIAFHEGNIDTITSAVLEAEVPGLRLIDAHDYGGFEVPSFIGDLKALEGPPRDSLYSIGYRHICRFHSMLWQQALA